MPFFGARYVSDCISCQEGYVCATSGITEMVDGIRCPAGEYCPSGSTAGIDCPSGSYCPLGLTGEPGSAVPISCPVGKYMEAATTKATTDADCKICLEHRYCGTRGLTSTLMDTNICGDGFVCAVGTNTASPSPLDVATPTRENLCPPG